MNARTAKKIVYDFYDIPCPTKEDRFQFCEAMDYIIESEKLPEFITGYGSYFYQQSRFDMALRYYEMAAEMNYVPAYECLGYIWYYGRAGTVDYKKAFECFSFAMERGSLVAAYKIADMYKNGYYVPKDEKKNIEIVEGVYEKVKDSDYLGDPVASVSLRLARIRKEQGRREEAIDLLLRAKHFQKSIVNYHSFFGDLKMMEDVVSELYSMVDFDEKDMDLFDLIYLFRKPASVTFWYKQRQYEIEAVTSDGKTCIRFGGKTYPSMFDLLQKGKIGTVGLPAASRIMYGFEVK